MGKYRILSGDDHIFEPIDLWDERLSPKNRGRLRVERDEDGSDWWISDDFRVLPMSPGAQAGLRLEAPERLTLEDTFENVRAGGYDPKERIKDMDIDGVDVSIMYSSVGLGLYSHVSDSELLDDVFRAYNDWLAEFCSDKPSRLKGIGMINLDNIDVGLKEMERCAKLGMIGAQIPVYPVESRAYNQPEYEPVWAAAQDLNLPLSLHIGTNRPEATKLWELAAMSAAAQCNPDHWTRMSLAHIIFSGVFERYPKLQVGSIEAELSWAPHFLDRLDYTYQQRARRDIWYRFKEAMLPSQYFHRNVFLGFQEDSLGIRMRDIIGVDLLQWGSDYPHHESTFPKSLEIIDEILADCTEEEKAKIVGGNVARVYNLN